MLSDTAELFFEGPSHTSVSLERELTDTPREAVHVVALGDTARVSKRSAAIY